MYTNEKIARWLGWIKTDYSPIPWLTPDSDRRMGVPPYDRGIGFWHGKHGLLRRIETTGIANRFGAILATDVFGEQWENQVPTGSCWTIILCSTPARLAKALIKTIEEEA